jgi:hypothetical protein
MSALQELITWLLLAAAAAEPETPVAVAVPGVSLRT